MYRVTLQLTPSDRLSLRVANQDLARVMAMAARLEIVNPGFQVTYAPDDQGRVTDAA
jgi:hypothetical protein